MTTITNGTITITPDLVLGWDSAREARTVMHPVLARPDPDVTLRPSAVRTGRLQLWFTDQGDAVAAELAHAAATVWSLDAGPDAPDLPGYVVSGPVTLHADGPDLNRWLVEVEYTEVVP
jgi:hypothetical protein